MHCNKLSGGKKKSIQNDKQNYGNGNYKCTFNKKLGQKNIYLFILVSYAPSQQFWYG